MSPTTSATTRAATRAARSGTRRRGWDDIDAGVAEVVGDLAHEQLLADLAAWPGQADFAIQEATRARWLAPATITLAATGNVNARSVLAVNPACPPDILARLARDRSRHVRAAAEANPSCPVATVHASGDHAALLRHRDCPLAVLEDALTRPTYRADALTNPALPWTTVQDLRPDLTWPELVSLLARADLTHPDAVAVIEQIRTDPTGDADATWQALAAWARHPNADPQWLHTQTEVALGRRGGAPNPARFGVSGMHVLTAVTSNPAAPPAALNLLATLRSRTGLAALGHPNCPPAAMLAALDRADGFTPTAPPQTGFLRAIPRAIAANPATPRTVLSYLGSPDLGSRGTFAFTYAHASTGPHARAVMAMLPTWTHTLTDALDAATDLLTDTGTDTGPSSGPSS